MKKYIPELFVALVVLYMLFLIRPALLGQLNGTFKSHMIPTDYIKLEQFLTTQKQFDRTFWIPSAQRFGFYSATHPAVSGEDFYHVASIAGVLDRLKKDDAEKQLQEASVKYVVVPFDSEGEMFLKDRKYDSATYKTSVETVQNISWLKEVPGFGKIHVFEVPNSKDHFYIGSTNATQPANCDLSGQDVTTHIENCGKEAVDSIQMMSPTEYIVAVKDVIKGQRLVFAESYDNGWKATVDMTILSSQPYSKTLNSFVLPQSGNYTLRIFYEPQKWVNIGLWISGITLIVCIVSLFSAYSWFRKSNMVE